jgi:hypothetical protein
MADAQKETERKGVASFKSGTEAAGTTEETEQLVVTINHAMGTIVKVERIDKAGKHQELSEQDCAKLVGNDEVEEIEAALEEAFEAGVNGVLGDEYETDGEYEDDEDKSIRRFLISELLVGRSVRRRIMHRLLLSRMLRRGFIKRRLRQS